MSMSTIELNERIYELSEDSLDMLFQAMEILDDIGGCATGINVAKLFTLQQAFKMYKAKE